MLQCINYLKITIQKLLHSLTFSNMIYELFLGFSYGLLAIINLFIFAMIGIGFLVGVSTFVTFIDRTVSRRRRMRLSKCDEPVSVSVSAHHHHQCYQTESPNVSESSSFDFTSDTTQVDQFVYPHILLCSHSKMRPIDRTTSDDYYISLNDTLKVNLNISIAVSYKEKEFVVVGNSATPFEKSKPDLMHIDNTDMYMITLRENTTVSIDERHDNVGLLRRLEDEQSFIVEPGSRILVPAGCEIYFRDDPAHVKMLTKESFVCTLLPPLSKKDADLEDKVDDELHVVTKK